MQLQLAGGGGEGGGGDGVGGDLGGAEDAAGGGAAGGGYGGRCGGEAGEGSARWPQSVQSEPGRQYWPSGPVPSSPSSQMPSEEYGHVSSHEGSTRGPQSEQSIPGMQIE